MKYFGLLMLFQTILWKSLVDEDSDEGRMELELDPQGDYDDENIDD